MEDAERISSRRWPRCGPGRAAGHRRLRHRLLVAVLLKRFRVDVLKVDRSFVAELGRDANDGPIMAAIIDLAHALGLRAVGEGVEPPDPARGAAGAGLRRRPGLLLRAPGAARRR